MQMVKTNIGLATRAPRSWRIKPIYSAILVFFWSLNGGKAAIALLKGMDQRLPLKSASYQSLVAGYDFEPIYEQIHPMGQQSVTAYNKRNEG